MFGSHWHSEETDFRVVGPVVDWAMEMYDGIDFGPFQACRRFGSTSFRGHPYNVSAD